MCSHETEFEASSEDGEVYCLYTFTLIYNMFHAYTYIIMQSSQLTNSFDTPSRYSGSAISFHDSMDVSIHLHLHIHFPNEL